MPLLELLELELVEDDELLELDELLEELLELEDELLDVGSPELEPLPPHAIKVADNNKGRLQRPKPFGFLWMRMCVTSCNYEVAFFYFRERLHKCGCSLSRHPNLFFSLTTQSNSHFFR